MEPADVGDFALGIARQSIRREIKKTFWKLLWSVAPYLGVGVLAFLFGLLALFWVLFFVDLFQTGDLFTPAPVPLQNAPLGLAGALQAASRDYHVPEQILAGVAMVESTWNPSAVSHAANSHAAGLMQFEPGTWSGSTDPFASIAVPDTDATRILKYGGYGVDADGRYAPPGFPASQWNLAGTNPKDGVPYASPYDPADALAAAAKYLRSLYLESGNWTQAVADYHGGASAGAYAESVLHDAMGYTADTPFVRLTGGGIFPLGKIGWTLTAQDGGTAIRPALNIPSQVQQTALRSQDRKNIPFSVSQMFADSVPVVMPAGGTVIWRSVGHGVVISLPAPHHGRVTLHVAEAMRFALSHTQTKGVFPAGTVVGFVDLTGGAFLTPGLQLVN